MADPVSMGVMVGMQMVGTVMGAVDEAKQLRRSARADRENARRTELQGEIDVLQARRDERAVSGEAIAAMAGNGFALGTGTAADLIRQNAIEREVEIGNLRYQANQDATALRQQAVNKKRQAQGVIAKGVMSAIAQGAQGASGIQGQGQLDAQAGAERASRLPTYNSFSGSR